MKKLFTVVIILLTLILVGCQQKEDTWAGIGNDSDIGKHCTKTSDCFLPGSYAVRSSCPFDVKCIDNKCAVVCQFYIDAEKNPELACKKDLDCNCSRFYAGKDVLRCFCLDNICTVIAAE